MARSLFKSPNRFTTGQLCALALAAASSSAPSRAAAGPYNIYISERSGTFGIPLSQIGEFSSATPATVAHKGASSSPTPRFIGLEVHPGTGVLYGLEYTPSVSIGSLRTINPATGASARVGGSPNLVPMAPNPVGGLAFDANGTTLWGTDSAKLFRIDCESGIAQTPIYDIRYNGQVPLFRIGAIAIAPAGIPTIPMGSIIGIAVYPSAPPHATELVLFSPDLMTFRANVSIITTITGDVVGPNFSPVLYTDQGLDFAPDGTLFACLMGNAHTATLFTISTAADATLGRATFLGRVQANFTWDVGSIAVASTAEAPCTNCRGDANDDGHVDARDVAGFIKSLLGEYEACCDMDDSGAPLSSQDVSDFAVQLINPDCDD